MSKRSLLPSPQSIGLPEKFSGWRRYQDEAVIALAGSDKRFSALVVPTGGGKSATYMAYARLMEFGRVAILTSTKALQDQLREFNQLDVRGKSNYTCVWDQVDEGVRVDEAPCQLGTRCPHKDSWEQDDEGKKILIPGSGCTYFDKVKQAKVADVVITNYSFWLSHNVRGAGLGAFDLLVLDEAHAAPDELAGYLALSISEHDAKTLLKMNLPTEHTDHWWAWLAQAMGVCDRTTYNMIQSRAASLATNMQAFRKLQAVQGKIAQILALGKEEWVAERTPRGMTWDISNPAPFAERFLFRNTPRVIFSSATVRQKTLDLLGVSKEESELLEYPSIFDPHRRPIYVMAGAPRLNFRSPPEHLDMWAELIDDVLSARSDRRGLIHTVSFKRAREIEEYSDHAKRMVLHGSGSEELRIALDVYMEKADSILVSPSVTTGVDLPGQMAEYCIIAKLPYPDMRSKVLKARMKADKSYPAYIAAQTMVQASGRGMRSEQDRFETFVVDGNWGWFMSHFAEFTPRWWRAAVKKMARVPPRPPRAPKL